jgi:hypothetical protein
LRQDCCASFAQFSLVPHVIIGPCRNGRI